jgi:hypothetical protein
LIAPSSVTSYPVDVFAFVQDAVTGQNATTPGGGPFVGSGCYIRPTGFTDCIVGAPYVPGVPTGHFKVTVFVTRQGAGTMFDSYTMLAPPSPAITGDFR